MRSSQRHEHIERESILDVFVRSLRLRCPACGQSSIMRGPFRIKHHCPSCRSLFKREEGFFVGAIMANVLATEGVILIVYFLSLLLTNLDEQKMLTVLFIVGLTFPPAFYHHSWSLWLGVDHLIEGLLPRNGESK